MADRDDPDDSAGASGKDAPAVVSGSDGAEKGEPWRWFWRGAANIASPPAFILMASFVGFGSLAREAGWTAGEAAMMTGLVWALPSQVVFIGSVAAGASLGAVVIGVALAAIRLLPMTVALLPLLKAPGQPRWIYYPVSHFVAITAWVVTLMRLPDIPRHYRLHFFAGIGLSFTTCNVAVTVLSHKLAGELPGALAAALSLLTPIYFIFALYAAARVRADYLALAIGLVLGPLLTAIDPRLDILWTGIIGGTLAYLLHRLAGRRT